MKRFPKIPELVGLTLIAGGTAMVVPPLQAGTGAQNSVVADYTSYVSMVQNANYVNGSQIGNTVLMRYPCGRIGLWSVNHGEIADVVTRGVILYPCIDTIVNKDNTDWRASFSGDPSVMHIAYKPNFPAKGSMVDLSVTPNVSIYRYRFSAATRYRAVAILANELGIDAHTSWNSNTWTRIDDRTVNVVLCNGNAAINFYLKFSVPCLGYGTINGSSASDGSSSIQGDDIGGYFKFGPTTDTVVVAVAISHTSMEKAQAYLMSEFGTLNFDEAVASLKEAWIAVLGRVEVSNTDAAYLSEFYTAMYSVYAVMFDAIEQPYYVPYNCGRLLTIGSSDFWQYMNGYARCEWDLARQVYPLLALTNPEVYRDNINTVQAQFNRDGRFYCDWHAFTGSGGGMPAEYLGHEAILPYLLGVPDGANGIDYRLLLASLKTHMANYTPEFWSYGYNPVDGSMTSNPSSRSLEQYASLKGIGILARLLGDTAAYNTYYPFFARYPNLWRSDLLRFSGKTKSGSWSDAGFFEGDGTSYRFMVPQDPYGILALHGADTAVTLIDDYIRNKSDFNDYKLNYEFLPMFADRADKTQDLVREHVAKFMHDGNFTMYEGLWGGNGLIGQGAFYTGNAGPLAACILGLWYTHTSGGTYLITAPSVDGYTIHGVKDLTVQVQRATSSSHHIRAITLDGNLYPCLQLSASTIASGDHVLALQLVDNPVKIGALYLSSSDGEVLACSGDLSTVLEFTIDPMAASCTAKVHSIVKPAAITLDGAEFTGWSYDAGRKLTTLTGVTHGSYRVTVEGAASPPGSFNLSSPANGANRVVTNPTLVWSPSARSLSYTLVVDDDSGYATPLFSQDVGDVTSEQISGLQNLTTYYWKVVAHNTYGDTVAANNSYHFTTAAAPMIIEAESMALTNYTVYSNLSASGGNLIKLAGSGLTGNATCAFPWNADVYDLTVFYYDENDGSCTFRVYVDGTRVDEWTADGNLGSPDPVAATRTSRAIAGVSIAHGAQIKLEAVQNAEEWGRFDCVEVVPLSPSSSILTPEERVPNGFSLAQNYPNPFNPETVIAYGLPESSRVRLEVYDMQGCTVRQLVNEKETAGWHSVRWDGTNAEGRKVASGLYLYRLSAVGSEQNFQESKKALLVK